MRTQRCKWSMEMGLLWCSWFMLMTSWFLGAIMKLSMKLWFTSIITWRLELSQSLREYLDLQWKPWEIRSKSTINRGTSSCWNSVLWQSVNMPKPQYSQSLTYVWMKVMIWTKELCINRVLMGSLLHWSNTVCPDNSYEAGYLFRFVQCQTKKVWQSVKRVLRYLERASNIGVLFRQEGKRWILGFSDASGGQEHLTRTSSFGLNMKCAGGAVAWKSNQQSILPQSSKESAFVAVNMQLVVGKEVSNLIGEVPGQGYSGEVVRYSDWWGNQAILAEVWNVRLSEVNKHIDLKFHLLVDRMRKEGLQVKYAPSEKMVADALNKIHQIQKFVI